MKLNLKGKKALITGASRGIGYAVAKELAMEGCDLHLTARNENDLNLAKKVFEEQFGVKVVTHVFDLSSESNVKQLALECGPVDILINNAGAIPHAPLSEFSDHSWKEGWDLKVFGFINLTREIYPLMCQRNNGVIINVAGVAGERPLANYIAGSMGNSALMTMSRALGAESVKYGVRVIAVNPGGIETDRQAQSWKQRAQKTLGDESRWRELAEKRPIKRLGSVEEISGVIVFLCSDRANYISGTVITVDGGTSAA